jgi:hypothetical protein
LTVHSEPHTFEDMKKDAVITVRVSRAARRRIETAARAQGRSLSQMVERLIDMGLSGDTGGATRGLERRRAHPLAGTLSDGLVPSLGDFRRIRSELSASLVRRSSR